MEKIKDLSIKLVGICASPKKGATIAVLDKALEAAASYDERIQTSRISLRGKKILACNDCKYCIRNQTWCCLKDDMQPLFDEIIEADALLVASPVYVMSATPQLHAFASRMRPAMHVYPNIFRNKFVAAIAVGGTRNGGQEMTIADIHNLFMTRAMNVVSNETGGYTGAKVWSKDQGADGAYADIDGLESAEKLARKLAETSLIYKMGLQVRMKELEVE